MASFHKNKNRLFAIMLQILCFAQTQVATALPAPVSNYTPDKLNVNTPGRRHFQNEPEENESNSANITRASQTLVRNPSLNKHLSDANKALEEKDFLRAQRIYSEANKLFPQEIHPLIGMARIAFILGKDDDAISLLKKFISKNPLASEVYSLLGDVYLGQNKFAEAKQALKSAISLEQGDSEALLRLAQIELRNQTFDTAAVYLRKALQANPHNMQARVLYARVLWYQEKIDESILEYNSALAQDSTNSILLSELAMLLLQKGKGIECMGKLNDAYRYDPQSIEIQKQYITVFGARRDWANALDAAKAWAQLDQNNAEAHAALAWSFMLNQEFDDAIDEINIAIKLAPTNPEIRNINGIIRLEMRQIDAAITQFKAAHDLDKNYLPASLNSITARTIRGQYQEAFDRLSQLEYSFPDDPTVFAVHSFVALKAGRTDEAKRLAEQAVKLSNDQALALITLAVIAREQGKLTDAEKALLEVKAKWSNSTLAILELSKTYLLENKGTEAVEAAQELLQLAPSNLDAKAALAVALSHQKNFDGPISLLKECIARNPKDLSLRIELAKAQLATGEADFAEMTLEKAKTLFPDKAEPLIGLADVSINLKNQNKAKAYLEEALIKDPHNSRVLVRLAQMKLDAGKADDCLAQLTGLSDAELGEMGLITRARAELKTRDFKNALGDFAQVARSKYLSPNDKIQFARAYFQTGQLQTAKTILAEINPSEHSTAAERNTFYKLQTDLKQDKVKNKN